MSRINEITFNASLLRELRNIDFVNRLLDDGTIAPGRMKRNYVHSVSDDALMNQLGLVTKMAISRTLLLQLRDAGRARWTASSPSTATSSGGARRSTSRPSSPRPSVATRPALRVAPEPRSRVAGCA